MKNIFLIIFTFISIMPAARATDQMAHWEKVCDEAKRTSLPVIEQNSSAPMAVGCDAQAFYYGIGRPVDDAAALRCAAAERNTHHDVIFEGDSILMMLYANGLGVKKNIPVALHFACELDGSSAEMEGRIAHLESLEKDSPPKNPPFDLCDDVTSGLMMGACAAKDDRLTNAKREVRFQALFAKWNDQQRTQFKPLQKSADAFTEARIENEVDLSGTARAMFEIQEEAIQKLDFLESLEKLEKNQAPHYTAAEAKAEDLKLNTLFQKIQKNKDDAGWGTVSRSGIKATQLAWLKYRDAWVAFAKLKYTSYSSESIAAWFTKKRNHMLGSFH